MMSYSTSSVINSLQGACIRVKTREDVHDFLCRLHNFVYFFEVIPKTKFSIVILNASVNSDIVV